MISKEVRASANNILHTHNYCCITYCGEKYTKINKYHKIWWQLKNVLLVREYGRDVTIFFYCPCVRNLSIVLWLNYETQRALIHIQIIYTWLKCPPLWFGITITWCHGKTFTSSFMMAYLCIYVHTRSRLCVRASVWGAAKERSGK